MHKHWKFRDSKYQKLILIKDQCIYIGNPDINDLNRLNSETKDLLFLDNLFSIPYSYIKKIENSQTLNKIQIYYGKDSEEELIIDNQNTKNEIFNFLKNENPNLIYTKKLPSFITYFKPQLFAILFILGFFAYTYLISTEIEKGVIYETSGGLGGIVLILANLGKTKVILIYIALLLIALFSIFRKSKTRSTTETLKRKK
jgi:hypothetical protein